VPKAVQEMIERATVTGFVFVIFLFSYIFVITSLLHWQ